MILYEGIRWNTGKITHGSAWNLLSLCVDRSYYRFVLANESQRLYGFRLYGGF